MSIEEFESNPGECIQVNYKESVDAGFSLARYHPRRICNGGEIYTAKTKLKSGKIRLLVNKDAWGEGVYNNIRGLRFIYDSGTNKLTAESTAGFPKINDWSLMSWIIEKKDVSDCDTDLVTSIHDTLIWTRDYPRQIEIKTSWTWIYNP